MDPNKSQSKLDFGFSSNNQFNNFDNNNTILEYKKVINKLENDLLSKEYELSSITNLYQELKKLNERLKQECESLANKINIQLSNQENLDKKHEDDLTTMKTKYEKIINDYESKILNYSSFNIDSIKNKIESDLQNSFNEKLLNKENEIAELENKISELEKNLILLNERYQYEKEEMQNEKITLKNLHQDQIKDLEERIKLLKNKNLSGDNMQNLYAQSKNEIENSKKIIDLLTIENKKLQNNHDLLLKEKNDLLIKNLELADRNKFNDNKYQTQIKNLQNKIENLSKEKKNLNDIINQKNFDIKTFYNEKIKLMNSISNKDIEIQELQNEIKISHNLLNTHQNEIYNNLIENEKNKKELMFKERLNEEKYQKEINDLKAQLKETKLDLQFDKNNLEESEYINELKKIIKDKNTEIAEMKKLNYDELIQKKNYYKNACKLANKNMKKLMEKLNKDQQKEFQDIMNESKNNNLYFEVSQSAMI